MGPIIGVVEALDPSAGGEAGADVSKLTELVNNSSRRHRYVGGVAAQQFNGDHFRRLPGVYQVLGSSDILKSGPSEQRLLRILTGLLSSVVEVGYSPLGIIPNWASLMKVWKLALAAHLTSAKSRSTNRHESRKRKPPFHSTRPRLPAEIISASSMHQTAQSHPMHSCRFSTDIRNLPISAPLALKLRLNESMKTIQTQPARRSARWKTASGIQNERKGFYWILQH